MNTKMRAIFMAAGMLLTFSSLSAQEKALKIDSLMKGYAESGKFSGAVLVAEKGSVVYKQGFGSADLKAGIANQPGTVFYIASITKPFTALLTMQLVEAGKIKLDHTLKDYFPALKNEATGKVTIHQLLSHTSGIPDFVDPSKVTSEKEMTSAWFTNHLNQIGTETVPGTAYKYANSTYVILAHIIEKVSGRSYAENLRISILDKSGMSRSGSLTTGVTLKGSAKGYQRNENIVTEADYTNAAVYKGAGSVYSTVEDLFNFDQALYTDRLISVSNRELMFSTAGNYGYGWFIRKLPDLGKVVYHEGGIPGYTGIFFRAIEKNYTIILLSNDQSNGPHKLPIVRAIAGILGGH